MALFVLNTGARDAAVCCLRWEWEVRSPELRYSIFVVPKDTVINVKGKRRGAVKGRKRDRVLVLNRVAQSIVEPDAHVVEGFNPGIMPPYTDLSEADLAHLVAYLLSLD